MPHSPKHGRPPDEAQLGPSGPVGSVRTALVRHRVRQETGLCRLVGQPPPKGRQPDASAVQQGAATLVLKGEETVMMTVRDVMTRSVTSVRRSTPLKDVAQLLVDQGISGVPVVDVDGAVLGVVSEADFLMKEQGAEAVRHRRLARILGESRESRAHLTKLDAVKAGEAMTAPAVTVASTCSIHEAAAVMTVRRVDRLPVVDDGRLVGIVSRADLVRAYIRSDEELAKTIREDGLLRILWLDPAPFTIVVTDGVASITGRVERRSTAEMIERTVSMVPGILAVHADVSWPLDDSRVEPVSVDPVFPFGRR